MSPDSLIEKLEAKIHGNYSEKEAYGRGLDQGFRVAIDIIRQHEAQQSLVKNSAENLLSSDVSKENLPTDTLIECRAAFEDWLPTQGYMLGRYDDGRYASSHTEIMWQAWKEAWHKRSICSEIRVISDKDLYKLIDHAGGQTTDVPAVMEALKPYLKRELDYQPFDERILINKALELYGMIDTEQMYRTIKAMRALNMSPLLKPPTNQIEDREGK